MKYYLIAGEASGDLHASHLITSLIKEDPDADFRFFGGDNMQAAAGSRGTLVRHYRDLAYMGFIPVLLHLHTIMKGMRQCKQDILSYQPDCVIFVDYAGFNLNIAKYLREQINLQLKQTTCQLVNLSTCQLFYYIAPKIWAWKESRIKNFKRDIDEMFCILPFEKEYFEGKHHYPIHYVGNPTADEVRLFKSTNDQIDKLTNYELLLLPGSRRQEIKDNLPAMLEAAKSFADDYEIVIAGAPGIEPEYYTSFTDNKTNIIFGKTYDLLSKATAALVTSGTATLETACFNVPQVVCYRMSLPRLTRWAFNHIIKCKYISLVNLIADKEVVPELFADRFSIENIRKELKKILPGGSSREQMLRDYQVIHERLGSDSAPDTAARIMVEKLRHC